MKKAAAALAALIAASTLSPHGAAAIESQPALLKSLGCGLRPAEKDAISARTRAVIRQAAARGRLTVLVVGSSSTAGTGAGDVKAAYPAVFSRLLAERLRALHPRVETTVIARGIGGEKATGAVARLEREIMATDPDLLVWQVGTNDGMAGVPTAELETTVRKGFAIARAHGLDVVLVDPQFYPKSLKNAGYQRSAETVDAIAAAMHAPVVNRYARMRAAAERDEALIKPLLARDDLHMSPLGHACLALDLVELVAPADGARSSAAPF